MNYSSLLVAVIVLSALIYFLMKQTRNKSTRKNAFTGHGSSNNIHSVNLELVRNKWSEIKATRSNGASGMRNALIEADKLLDYVMIQKGFNGNTMGDRLKNSGDAFGSSLNEVWAAHKLRNQIAHEVEHDLVAPQVKKAIDDLGVAIRRLGVNI